MKKIFLLACLSIISSLVLGQTGPFSLYMYDAKIINPAFTGSVNEQSFNVLYNANTSMRTGNGHPSNVVLSYDNQISSINSGIGLIFSSERIGARTVVAVSVPYNYQLQISEISKLSLGLSFNYITDIVDFSQLNVIGQNDPILANADVDKNFNLDFGVAYSINTFSVGVAVKNIFQSKTELGIDADQDNTQVLSSYVSHKLELNNWLTFRPSLFISTNYDTWLIDLNALAQIKALLAGLTYRMGEIDSEVKLNLGVTIKDRVQLLGLTDLTSHKYYSSRYEFMLRIKIRND